MLYSLPSTSSSISRKKYDVFLSFRGEDTRKNFTDHLYEALKRSGIVTFRDDQKLDAGEEIAPEVFTAIQQSLCSVIVFSETYACSGWCLEELAEIVKQRNENGHKVFPIFYHVEPSDLRKQKEKVEEAFAKHEERCKEDKEKILRWRKALTQVANIKGWHLKNRHESGFIGDIVRKISATLCQTYPVFHDELVGISSRLEELYSKIEIGEDDIRIIGICGMGGIGKTTLARVVYDQMSSHFQAKCFIADVRQVSDKFGLVSLQKQLLLQILSDERFEFFNVQEGNTMIRHRLSHKKVLVVIDDVDNLQHLKCLVGRHDWFGLGSRIIVTTRDEHLLESYRVDAVYKPSTLNNNDARQLFNLKAFGSETVPDDVFVKLSEHVAKYAGGLPLALEVLGSFLCGRDVAQWRSAIRRLEMDSNKEIIDRLRISFDGLEEMEKNIFLDIACFFHGDDKDIVMKILDGCGFFSDIGMDVLVKKSLLTVNENNKLGMHNLLQEMGRKIVREKCIEEPGKRCRLWEEKDVYHVLNKNTATEAIEGMVIDSQRELKSVPDIGACREQFTNPSKLCNARDWTRYNVLHCYGLVENINAATYLKKCLQRVAYMRKSFDVVIPGSEIPKWLSHHQTVGSSIKIPLPSDSRWTGVAFCCIFVNDDASRDEELTCEAVIAHRNTGQAGSGGSVFRGRNTRPVTVDGWIFSKEYNQPIVKDHYYFCYLTPDRIYPFSLEDKCGENGTENLSISDCSNQEFDELQVSIISNDCHRSVKVKKCGIRIVYQKDLEDISEDSIADGSIANGPLIKRKRDAYEKTEARPHPKRMEKFFNFMMGRPEKKN